MTMSRILKQGVQVDVELSLPLQQLWDALLNLQNVAPKIALAFSHKLLKGNGGVGSVSAMQFADGRYEKERVDSVDYRTYSLVSSVIAQDSATGFNQYTKTMALSPARDGTTTIARWRAECVPTTDGSSPVSRASDYALLLFRALENYYLTTAQEISPAVNGDHLLESEKFRLLNQLVK